MGRALLSCVDEEDALAIARDLLPSMSRAQEKIWRDQLASIRECSYAVSLGQSEPGVNAVASPIAQAGEAYLVVGFVAHARDLPARRIDELGRKLAQLTRELQEHGLETETQFVARRNGVAHRAAKSAP